MPITPIITAAQHIKVKGDNASPRINMPASTDTTVIRFEYDALFTGGSMVVE